MPTYDNASPQRKRLKRYVLLAAIVALVVVIVYLLSSFSGNRGTITGTKLRCIVSQEYIEPPPPCSRRTISYSLSPL